MHPPQANGGLARTSTLFLKYGVKKQVVLKTEGIYLVLKGYSNLIWDCPNTKHSPLVFQGKILSQDVNVISR